MVATAQGAGVGIDRTVVFGMTSTILWSLTLVVSNLCVRLFLRADNEGEAMPRWSQRLFLGAVTMMVMNADPRPDHPRHELAVTRATGEDWAVLRSVRLAALAESPSAFGSSLGREEQYDEGRWRSWATSASVFLLTGDGEACGMAAGVAGGPQDVRQVVAVWIRPAWRGQGGAELLLTGVEQWARGEGARRLELWLTRGNLPARRTYARRGYVDTGRSKPLRSNPDLLEDEMALLLG